MKYEEALKYPIKYAIMPIVEKINYQSDSTELGARYGVVANIVLKCYVLKKIEEYISDENVEVKYEVMFLYNRLYDEFEPLVNKNNIYPNENTKSIFVKQLFNNFEEALIVADKYNEKIILAKDSKKEVEIIKDKIDKYKIIEEKIEKETCDVEITYSLTLEEIIAKAIEDPREFYIKIANSLSVKEKEQIKNLIENKCCANYTNGPCRCDEVQTSQENCCLGLNNKELIGRKKLLIKTFDN